MMKLPFVIEQIKAPLAVDNPDQNSVFRVELSFSSHDISHTPLYQDNKQKEKHGVSQLISLSHDIVALDKSLSELRASVENIKVDVVGDGISIRSLQREVSQNNTKSDMLVTNIETMDERLVDVEDALNVCRGELDNVILQQGKIVLWLSSVYEVSATPLLREQLVEYYSWIQQIRSVEFLRSSTDLKVIAGFKSITDSPSSQFYIEFVRQLDAGSKLGTTPPSLEFNFLVTGAGKCGVMKGTMSNLRHDRKALLHKLCQLERQALFLKGYTGENGPHFIGFVSPSFTGDQQHDVARISRVVRKHVKALANVQQHIRKGTFHVLKIGSDIQIP